MDIRHDWSEGELRAVHDLPLPELMWRAQAVHRRHHDPREVQLCTLLSIKTGGCPEDCGYCPQSARYRTGVPAQALLDVDEVLAAARAARAAGSTRFCMGAAWREVKDGPEFDRVLEMVRGVRALGLEACCTLGMLTASQAERLARAGLSAYNHNLDTGPEDYARVISTRTYADRLDTLARVRAAGITVCAGGIIGMGETLDHRLALLGTLARLDPHPESVPINSLVRAPGTPLAASAPLEPLALVRIIATALSPLLVTTIGAALDVLALEPERRARLRMLAARFRAQLGMDGDAPIVPVVLGANETALRVAEAVRAQGYDVRAVRPPTVPAGTARLRVSIHADHSVAEVDGLAAAIRACVR